MKKKDYFVSGIYKEYISDKNRLLKALEALEDRIDKELKENFRVECSNVGTFGNACGKFHLAKDIDLIQHYFYVEPYSCSAGDYWIPKEYYFYCPECNLKNIIDNEIPKDWKDKPKPNRNHLVKFTKYFREVIDEKQYDKIMKEREKYAKSVKISF